MTSNDIQKALVSWTRTALYTPNKVLAVPNTYAFGHEADLIVVMKSDWAHEIEIKISASDFKREFVNKKQKHEILQRGIPKLVRNPEYNSRAPKESRALYYLHDYSEAKPHLIRNYWFAIPFELLPKIEADVPAYAGIIVVENGRARKHKPAPVLKNSRKTTDADKVRLLQSCYSRYWEMKVN